MVMGIKRGVIWLALLLCSLLLCSNVEYSALAQTNPDLSLELGIQNSVVADHWNPLKLTRRDQPAQRFVLVIDQGSLRDGETLVTYQRDLPPAPGLDVFEDDVYIPTWRQFSWRIENDERVFASGSLERREVNATPLTLLLSSQPERYKSSFSSDTRLLELPFSLLPERVAAYDGVQTLLLDGSASAPTLEAITAAAVSGVNVLLLGDLPDSHRELSLLAPELRQHLGAGWIARTSEVGVRATLSMLTPLAPKTLRDALMSGDLSQRPMTVPQLYVGGGAALYALLLLVLLRFFGNAGLLTSFLIATLTSVAAWTWLRPKSPQLSHTRTLIVNHELALVHRLESVFTLPQAQLSLNQQARLTALRAYTQHNDSLELSLPRYSEVLLEHRPSLSRETLKLEGQQLYNLTDTPLHDVYVKGLGPQPDLEPGGVQTLTQADVAEVTDVPVTQSTVAQIYEALLDLLPDGTALAHADGTFHIALPELLSLTEAP
ncbi:MAG: hypothetical protein ACRCYY_07685 [Trueperaceae bacterium]